MSVVRALQPVVEALERLGVPYHVGGSVASSAHGSPRATNDVDVVVDLQRQHVEPLCAALGADYYVSPELLQFAIARGSSANLVHLPTGYKVDLFVCRAEPYDRMAMTRFAERVLEPNTREFRIATAEDVLIRKLLWYRSGGESSDRQWSDVLGVLRLREPTLDRDYLEQWSCAVGVQDLLLRARDQLAKQG